ncbi:EF-hand calcium-binding domain-containing protein 3-like [Latimeria chalumnae]|uniref:EF-hand calcium-binding domain-containing protein 3-like n=1 Tax=Latimeria chalumnae TaxID=7897 RepID=UPI00313D44C5
MDALKRSKKLLPSSQMFTEKFEMPEEPLTEKQIKAFQSAFGLFEKNSKGIIDISSLECTLKMVGIEKNHTDIQEAFKGADIDVPQGCESKSSFTKEAKETIFYDALSKMVEMSALSDKSTGEIVKYYHKKYNKVKEKKPDDSNVIGNYLKAARLIALTDRQLIRYLEDVKKQNASIQDNSPYTKVPGIERKKPKNEKTRAHQQFVRQEQNDLVIPLKQEKPKESEHHRSDKGNKLITPANIKVNLPESKKKYSTYDDKLLIKKQVARAKDEYMNKWLKLKSDEVFKLWQKLKGSEIDKKAGNTRFSEIFSIYTWTWNACQEVVAPGELNCHGIKAYRQNIPSSRTQPCVSRK